MGQVLHEQKPGMGQDGMPDSPLREAFELISRCLLHNEEFGVRVTAIERATGGEAENGPGFAIGKAVRTGLAMVDEDFLGRRMLRRGPRNAEMLRWVYGRDDPPTIESIRAAARERRRRREATRARLKALREAGRPKEHNTAASLPAWVP